MHRTKTSTQERGGSRLGFVMLIVLCCCQLAAAGTLTWTGAVNNDWKNRANWEDGAGTSPAGPPTAADDVVIPADAPVMPTAPDGGVHVSSIKIEGDLNGAPGKKLIIKAKKSVTVGENGRVRGADGTAEHINGGDVCITSEDEHVTNGGIISGGDGYSQPAGVDKPSGKAGGVSIKAGGDIKNKGKGSISGAGRGIYGGDGGAGMRPGDGGGVDLEGEGADSTIDNEDGSISGGVGGMRGGSEGRGGKGGSLKGKAPKIKRGSAHPGDGGFDLGDPTRTRGDKGKDDMKATAADLPGEKTQARSFRWETDEALALAGNFLRADELLILRAPAIDLRGIPAGEIVFEAGVLIVLMTKEIMLDPGVELADLIRGEIVVDPEWLGEAPFGALIEPEPCGWSLNDGCDAGGETTAIALGDEVWGSAWAQRGRGDTDWFRLTLNRTVDLQVELSPQFDADVTVLDGAVCESQAVLELPVAAGSTGVGSVELEPGEYLLVVRVAAPELECGRESRYLLSIDGFDPVAICYADCDGSGGLDFFDFLCFQDQFAAGSREADCDGSGSLDFFDFLCFQDAFASGCP